MYVLVSINMKIIKRVVRTITTAGLTAGLALSGFATTAAVYDRNTTDAQENIFDRSYVLDDLDGSKDAAGNVFDIANYPQDDNGDLQMYTFMEFGYAAASEQTDYALYTYVYNPAARAIDTKSKDNAIQMAVTFDEAGAPTAYEKFQLEFCNCSTGEYSRLFYKFRVIDHTSSDGKTIAERVDPAARTYVISGIELRLQYTDTIQDTAVGGAYTFTGYAAGYGSQSDSDSTLQCMFTPQKTIDLDVQQTYYRYPKTTETATQVTSVYFSIDNDLIEEYGALYAIAAEYYEYMTAPLYVTKCKEFYDAIYNDWLGKSVGSYNENCDWGFYHVSDTALNGDAAFNYSENRTMALSPNYPTMDSGYDVIDKIAAIFYSGDENANTYMVSSEDIESHFKTYTQEHGSGSAYNGYNDDLFATGGAGYTRIETTADDLFDLEGFNTGSSFWNWWYDILGRKNEDLRNIEPIHPITAEELRSDDLSNTLLIAPADVEDFKEYCDDQMSQNKTVFLFRFAVSEYAEDSGYAILEYTSEIRAENHMNYTTELSARQEMVYLGFDIISLTFQGDEGELAVLPVVADPTDIIHDSEGIDEIIDHVNNDAVPWWVYLIVATALLLILFLLRLILVKLLGLRQWIFVILVLAVLATIPLYITPLANWVYGLIGR